MFVFWVVRFGLEVWILRPGSRNPGSSILLGVRLLLGAHTPGKQKGPFTDFLFASPANQAQWGATSKKAHPSPAWDLHPGARASPQDSRSFPLGIKFLDDPRSTHTWVAGFKRSIRSRGETSEELLSSGSLRSFCLEGLINSKMPP